jgi:uncharacterized protein YjiS (DUF1127 family)
MTTRIAKDEMALLMPHSLGHYFQDDTTMQPETNETTLFARISAALSWIVSLPRRQAVLAELNSLSDHELSDIGLSRGELPMVFDADFVARRQADRLVARVQSGRAALI